jgi:gluconate 2-dehydrogenase gamma chain
MTALSRRTIIKVTGAIGATLLPASLPGESATAHESIGAAELATHSRPAVASASRTAPSTTYVFFNTEEAAFIEAAVARLIPADQEWGGALEACVPNYIDKQLAGAWGAGERLYRSGPWQPGTPSQGYQLPYVPAELFRTALAAINKQLARTPFAAMNAHDQDTYLKQLEEGGMDLDGVPSEVFFAHLWQSTIEGFFSDPVYGGNDGMLSWRMIGFPGAYASYFDLVDKHGLKLERAPVSLAQDAHGHVHANPGIPASSP